MLIRIIQIKLLVGLLALAFGLQAQTETPFLGRQVGVYVSKRGITFGEAANLDLASFVQHKDSLGLQGEALKLAFSIRLGIELVKSLDKDLEAYDSYFVNAKQPYASLFLNQLPNSKQARSVLPPGTKYVLLIDELKIREETRRTVMVISNQMRSVRRNVELLDVKLRLFDTFDGEVVATAAYTYDHEAEREWPNYLSSFSQDLQSTAFLRHAMNQGLHQLFTNL